MAAPVPTTLTLAATEARAGGGRFTALRRFVRRKPLGALCAVFLLLLLALAIAAPALATHDPTLSATREKLQGPSARHYLGTDELGRDLWSRLLYGARVSLTVGYGATVLAVVIAGAIALASGYAGRWLDLTVQRVVDAFLSIPSLLVILSVVTILDPTVFNLVLLLGVLFGIRESRIIRSAVLGVKSMLYVDAARSLGAAPARVVLRHVLPNVVSVIIVVGSLTVARVIIVEASLSFLGFGVPPPQPTWGQMLSGTARKFMTQAPWMGIAPGVALSLTVLAFNLLGDALRDVFDPRMRER